MRSRFRWRPTNELVILVDGHRPSSEAQGSGVGGMSKMIMLLSVIVVTNYTL